MADRFFNRTAAMITKHGKERIIGPILWDAFNISLELARYDTDMLGTFSGEVERPSDQLGTARLKIQQAANISNASLLLASEGAFHPHPDSPFVTVNTELIILYDRKTQQEIVARHTTFETNAAKLVTKDTKQLLSFVQQLNFPKQRIILSSEQNGANRIVFKDLHNLEQLTDAYWHIREKTGGAVVAETDLRAMNNATRQEQIKLTAEKLVQLMQTECPSCKNPGYQIQAVEAGLPCCWCNTPTSNTLQEIYRCTICAYEEKKRVSKPCADPGTCNQCNP
jgi:hypothetical protein